MVAAGVGKAFSTSLSSVCGLSVRAALEMRLLDGDVEGVRLCTPNCCCECRSRLVDVKLLLWAEVMVGDVGGEGRCSSKFCCEET